MTTTLTKPQRLANLEHVIERSWKELNNAWGELGWAIHEILEEKLWVEALDDDGNRFTNQNDYLRHLADRVGIGRTTLLNVHRAIRLADSLGRDLDDIREHGGIKFFERISRRVDFDPVTGDIRLKRAMVEIEDPKEYINKVVDEVAPNGEVNLRPKDIEARLTELLAPGTAYVYLAKVGNSSIKWVDEYIDKNGDARQEEGDVIITLTGNPRPVVMEEIEKMLRVSI